MIIARAGKKITESWGAFMWGILSSSEFRGSAKKTGVRKLLGKISVLIDETRRCSIDGRSYLSFVLCTTKTKQSSFSGIAGKRVGVVKGQRSEHMLPRHWPGREDSRRDMWNIIGINFKWKPPVWQMQALQTVSERFFVLSSTCAWVPIVGNASRGGRVVRRKRFGPITGISYFWKKFLLCVYVLNDIRSKISKLFKSKIPWQREFDVKNII